MRTAIVWLRRDLRMNDNPALAAASEAERIVPLFCFERGLWDGRHSSPNRNAYLLASLRDLDADLRSTGARLHFRSGDPAVVLARLATEAGAEVVHVNRDHTAHSRARDQRVGRALADGGVELIGHNGIACAEIARIETGSGGPYRVFTPFYRAWARAGRRELAKRPRRLAGAPSGVGVGSPPTKEEMGVDARAERIAGGFGPGETAARRAMRRALERADAYHRVRDLAGDDATTKLSPQLHFGTISARELETELLDRGTKGATELRRQLAWRDFWLNVIRHFPGNRELEYDERMRGMRWRTSDRDFEAWCEGRTGVPWIDAGMRQLREEGWMHNRVRMAVASYLTKNLRLHWRRGEAHFMAHLLDGDESQNNGNWQWAASTGADPQPYFRIFNPVKQQEKFDPDGTYVRRWVPELADLPDGHLGAPWEAPPEVLAEAGIALGDDYPEPLVDLKDSRAEAIERFGEARGG
ncbi:MAG TPA: deoxyribodipyrimidine photo-lyase [Solirubrobacterales bacterium]|nr:deoxyribodipyrimidine photo-lyase [Solirubrobacterales bacterium]